MTERTIDLQLAFARTVPDHMGLAVAATELEAGNVPSEILLMPAGTVQTRPHDGREAWTNANPEAVIAASRELSADPVIDSTRPRAKSNASSAPH
ncbi:MAG: hypothetical protein GDA49_00820 [Rhodospirillales bacterium]|nr:hypothetical protein [Rhodospirillales bacterium]